MTESVQAFLGSRGLPEIVSNKKPTSLTLDGARNPIEYVHGSVKNSETLGLSQLTHRIG